MGRGPRRGNKGAEAKPRERQIWITDRHGCTVRDSLEAAALYTSNEAGAPVSAGQVFSALTLGFPLCGMTYSHTKPEHGGGKRPPLLRRNRLEEGTGRIY